MGKKDIVTGSFYGDLSYYINPISFSSNGDIVFLTTPIRLFRYNGTEWEREDFPEDIPSYDRHAGYIVNETAFILYDYDDGEFPVYSLYAYEFNNGSQSWEFVYEMMSSDTTTQTKSVFGYSVVGIDDFLFIGEPTHFGDEDVQPRRGYVNVYKKINGIYTQVDRLQASDSHDGYCDYFGSSIDVYGDYLIVGAPYVNDAGGSSGAVYIFKNVNGIWGEVKKVISSDINILDNFGWTCAINEEYFLVGAPTRDNLEGGIYFYQVEDLSLHSEFAADRSDTNVPKVVQFNSVCIGNPTSYLWDFGDGSTSTEENPIHEYAINGDYTVTLTINDGETTDVCVKENYVQVNSELVWGDLNLDGITNVLDVTVYVNVILQVIEPTEEQVLVGDINSSGSIDVLDLMVVIYEIILGGNSSKTQPASIATITQTDQTVSIKTDGAVAGVQLHTTGDWQMGTPSLDGFEIQSANVIVLIYSLTGATFSGTTELFTYAGEMEITDVIVADANGNAVETAIAQLPAEFALFQNYPNPFNPTTQINYQLPATCSVLLAIYNLQGRLVETLVNEPQNPGYYSVSFDGSGYSSGVYFYRLSTPEFQNVKKMVLLR